MNKGIAINVSLPNWNTINPKNTSSIKTDQLLLQSILKLYKYIGPMVINNISICKNTIVS